MSCKYRVKQNNKGCTYFQDRYCTCVDAQYYRCPISIARGNYKNIYLSKSQWDSWQRCPQKWFFEQIAGIQVKERKKSISLRQGTEIGRLLALKFMSPQSRKELPENSALLKPTFFAAHETYYLELIHEIVEIVAENEMLPKDAQWEVLAARDNLEGRLDLIFSVNHFAELKYGQRPEWYFTSPIARNQLEFYCYIRPDMKNAHMLPIRAPALKDKIDEDYTKKLKRTKEDIKRRMNHYFPYYEKDKTPPKWGRSWSHLEWKDVKEGGELTCETFEKEIDWTRREIQMACKGDFFIPKRAMCTSPGECDFLPILESGGIDWDRYERRDRDNE